MKCNAVTSQWEQVRTAPFLVVLVSFTVFDRQGHGYLPQQ